MCSLVGIVHLLFPSGLLCLNSGGLRVQKLFIAFLMLESFDFVHVLAIVFLLGMTVGALATMLMIKCGLCGFGRERSAPPGPWHIQKIQKILPEEIYICRSSRCFHVSQTCQKGVQAFPICQHCLKKEVKKLR